MKSVLAVVVVFCVFWSSVDAYSYGLDVSDYVPTSGFSCLVNNGYMFSISRIYKSVGALDYNGPPSMANAWAAGMRSVDGYMFPCFPCRNSKSAKFQANEVHTHLTSTNTKFGMIWIDVEIFQWGGCSDNVAFLQDMVDEFKSEGVRVGIYTNSNNWKAVTCDSHNLANLPLWYANYDGNPSFGDFAPFGGWTQPAIKQYVGDTTQCGIAIDKNSY